MSGLGIDFLSIIIYSINFGIILFLLQRFAYKPVLNMLQQRQQHIATGLEAADKAFHEAAQQRAEFEKELAKARSSSQDEARKVAEATEKMRQGILVAAQKEADELKARAREEAELERQQLTADLQKQAAELAMQISRKIVDGAIDENAQRKLVDRFLADLGDA